MTRVIYATAGWGIHDDRWVTALRTLDFDPVVVSLSVDTPSPTDLRHRMEDLRSENPDARILAGPLDSVTAHLGQMEHVVGLSWGFDLQSPSQQVLDLIPQLGGLIVDTEINRQLAVQQGLEADRVVVLPWGVDLDHFTPRGSSLTARDLNVPRDAPIVLSLRAHEPIYRISDIIDAFTLMQARDPDPILILGNSGSLTPELQEQASRSGFEDRVFFIGQREESDLPALLRAASVYVSASEVDGTSVTMLQAMACGTPCIVTDLPQNRAWIEDGVTGSTFAVGDAAQLADIMTRTLDGISTTVTSAARERVEREADWSRNLPKLAAILNSA